jgi:putative PIN family toxin of toxin-antitoxin system
MTRKIVIDTSSLISAALRPRSIPDQAVKLALSNYEFWTSADHLQELEEVLRRKHFDSYVDLASRLFFLQNIRANAQSCIVPQSILEDVKGCCRDKSDDFLLALALAAEANLIISSDHDLLVLHPWRGIPIVTPAQFVAEFSR